MELKSAVLLIVSAVLLGNCVSQATAQNDYPGQLEHDLSFSLPVVFVSVGLIAMLITSVILLRRAKNGYFCCMKPRVRYPVIKRTTHTHTQDVETATPPPSYEMHPQGNTIAPPDYEDALNDAIVSPRVEDDIDSPVTCDDRAPLNP